MPVLSNPRHEKFAAFLADGSVVVDNLQRMLNGVGSENPAVTLAVGVEPACADLVGICLLDSHVRPARLELHNVANAELVCHAV